MLTIQKQNQPRYKFTIIIPTYNCANYISHALDSLVAQGPLFYSCQVLVVDDGSTDRTHEVVYCYTQQYPKNVFYTKKHNGNWGSVINYVKNNHLAKGEMITVLDADDYYSENMLQEVDKYRDKDMVVTDFYCFDQNGRKKPLAVYFHKLKKRPILSSRNKVRTPHSQPLGKFYSSHLFYLLRDLQENKWYQDCVMYHMSVGMAENIQYIDEPLATWFNKRPGNSTTTPWSNDKKFNDWCSTLKSMNEFGAGIATCIYAMLPGFISELKKRKKILKLPRRPNNNWMPALYYFLFKVWIYLKARKHIKYCWNKVGTENGILSR